MTKQRLDKLLILRDLSFSRSQATNWIRLGEVVVNGAVVSKPSYLIDIDSRITITADKQYVSRAGLKLSSVAEMLRLDFENRSVLDVGSSTGGFTDFALQNKARKVVAIDVGTNQIHRSLMDNPKIELHEKTDIRDLEKLSINPDIILVDVSFISLRKVLPALIKHANKDTIIVALFKPQFETNRSIRNKGVVKNEQDRIRLLRDFESWMSQDFIIIGQADSLIKGDKGNLERFYKLKTKTG